MKKIIQIICLFAGFQLIACKSTKKLYDQGNYERAVYSSVDDLKKNPNNASAVQVLPNAYQQASRQFLSAVSQARNSGQNSIEQLDKIYNSYASLQRMYNAVMSSPGAMRVLQPTDYAADLQDAANAAANAHYNLGLDFLDRGDKKSAQKAYENFVLVDKYVPGFSDVQDKKEQAYDRAVTNIAVNSINQQFGYYSVNGSFLENDLLSGLNNIGRNYYNRFYTVNDAQYKGLRVDQFMDINIYNIWFGQLMSNNYSYTVSKTVTEPGPTPKDKGKTVTVSATVNVTRRIIDSRAAMDCRITDAADRRILYNERFPAQYTWEKLTGTYTGDSRALSDKDRAIINGAYNNPPAYDELYRELMRKVLTDFNNRMRQIYAR